MIDYQQKHYYIQQEGRNVSDFSTLREAREYVQNFGGTIAVETVGELDCE